MNIANKMLIKINPSNLNRINMEKLTEEDIEYALKCGFNYKMEVDDRYNKFPNYIEYNLYMFPEYISYYLDKYYFLPENHYLRSMFMNELNNNFELFYKALKYDIGIINLYKGYNNLSKEEKEILVKYLIYEKNFLYDDFPDNIKKDNYELGLIFLRKDFKENIKNFVDNNPSIENTDSLIELFMNIEDRQKYLEVIFSLIINSENTSIETIKQFLEVAMEANNRNICNEIVYKYPELINSTNNIDNVIDSSILIKLFNENRYLIDENTPNNILKLLLIFDDIIIMLLEKDFNYYLNLVDIFFSNNQEYYVNYDWFKYYETYKKQNYFLTANSPLFAKRNFLLVLDSL